MPWCPKCKTEYQEGIEVCADCGTPLVDELPDEEEMRVVAFISEEALANKLVDYLGYSDIKAECHYDECEESYAILVGISKFSEAKTAFRAFYSVESKNMLQTDIERHLRDAGVNGELGVDEELLEEIPEEEMSRGEKEAIAKAVMAEQVYKSSEVYVKKADVSKDMFSTAITFLAFAVLLLVFLVLNALEIITMFNNLPSLLMIGAMAVGCSLVGINAIKRSRRAEIDSVEEDKITSSVEEWLRSNITDDFFADLNAEELGEEILYLRRTEKIRTKLAEAYPDLDENFADSLIEDFYNEYYENAETEASDTEAPEETEE